MKSDELVELEKQTKLLLGIHNNQAALRYDVQNAIIRAEKKQPAELVMGCFYIPEK